MANTAFKHTASSGCRGTELCWIYHKCLLQETSLSSHSLHSACWQNKYLHHLCCWGESAISFCLPLALIWIILEVWKLNCPVSLSVPERSHADDRCPDDGLHSGDDQHWESGGLRQALLYLQCLQGAALRPGGRHGLLDQQGSDRKIN